jgi:ketosteroid isomerase-like protein
VSERRFRAVRAVYEAVNRRDLDAMVAGAPADFVMTLQEIDPSAATELRDPEEVRRHLEDFFDSFETLETEVEELVEVGDSVIAVVRHRALGRESQVEVERREAHLWTFEGAQAVALAEYATREEALRAAASRRPSGRPA